MLKNGSGANKSFLRRHRSPYLFHSHPRRRSNRAPSHSAHSRQLRWIEIQTDFVARSKHDKLIVERRQQRQHITVAGIGSGWARVRSSCAHLLVNILHVSRRSAFDLQGISVELQIGVSQRNWRQARVSSLVRWRLRGATHQNVVPINLQIGCDANLLRVLSAAASCR